MYNCHFCAHAINMKKFVIYVCIILLGFCAALTIKPIFVDCSLASQTDVKLPTKNPKEPQVSLMAIVIDDFGGYSRAGVDELLQSSVPITCAILPMTDNSLADFQAATESGKEVILHMPMQAHVNLPENWYGSIYIKNDDSTDVAIEKLEKALACFPNVKGFNIHIGSGASQNVELMKAMYDYANEHNLYFLDSRTILADKCEEACTMANSIYLGRDVFLEPEHNKSYSGVMERLNEAMQISKEKGYAIVIGHVGPEGGYNTARAIIDFAAQQNGIEIVPLSTIFDIVKNEQFK